MWYPIELKPDGTFLQVTFIDIPETGRRCDALRITHGVIQLSKQMIQSFKDGDTADLFQERQNRRWRGIKVVALRMLEAASDLRDLRIPPGNRLELLSGARRGQHSIRINDQYRICFVWKDDGPHEVEIVDYHS